VETDVPDFSDPGAIAERLRWATDSLTDPSDQALVRDYLRELDDIAREQAAEDLR
jgi:hypothetical protein